MEIPKEYNSMKCGIWGDTASNICFKCINYYCDSCYTLIHSKKQNSEHKKRKINYCIPIDIKCPIHPEVPINLFCVDEKGKKIFIK